MAVVGEADLHLVDLGIRMPAPGNPDGRVSAAGLVIHDAGGGTATVRINQGSTGDVLVKIDRIVIEEILGTDTTGVPNVIMLGPSRFYEGSPPIMSNLAILAGNERRVADFPEGWWFMGGNVLRRIMQFQCTNTNGAGTALGLAGWYWYMSRLRLQAEDIRRW